MTADFDDFDAIVYDCDGTLVRLAVDWEAAAREAAARLSEAGVDAGGMDLWAMLDLADETGHREELEDVLSAHECEGAADSARLPLADRVSTHDVPVGVCSLNAECAVREALSRHGLAEYVDVVVGRDSVSTRKPDPEPLLATLRALGVDPDRALFVGDSERDAETAARAGVAFRYVGDGPSGH
ncbi:MAG: HAD family hydrolase [Haloferacaceae archaeon]